MIKQIGNYIFVTFLLILMFFSFKNSTSIETIEKLTSRKIVQQNNSIEELTSEKVVINYIKKYKKLPNYYITKNKARKKGWIAREGNLCEIIANHAIGGDIFTNREGNLPIKNGRIYYEADINYHCGTRQTDRLIFSNDELIFVTFDHYKTFQKR